MNRKLLLIFLLFISPYFIICVDETDECNDYFETIKTTECQKFNPTNEGTDMCSYDDTNGCRNVYKSCSLYTVGVGETINSETCTNIPATTRYEKCMVDGNECKEKNRLCKDYISGEDDCESLHVLETGTESGSEDTRCVLVDSVCKAHYKDCTKVSTNNGDQCINNIPEDQTTICVWKGETDGCKSQPKACSKYAELKKLGFNVICNKLTPTNELNECVLDGENCIEIVKSKSSCNKYVNDEDTLCGDFIATETIGEEKYLLNYKKCTKNTVCTAIFKSCSEYTTQSECETNTLHVEDSTKTRCIFEGGNCIEKSIACSAFENDATKEVDENKAACAAISPYNIDTDDNSIISLDEHSKCELDGTQCKKIDKECEDIEKKDVCLSHYFTSDEKKTTKKCIYNSSETPKCKEVYMNCNLYNENVSPKTSDGCTEIYLNDLIYRCSFDSDNNCNTLELDCSVANDKTKEYCSSLKPTNDTHYCLFTDDKKCIEQYISCNGVKDLKECHSNVPKTQNSKCYIKDDKTCEMKKKDCSDYKGNMEDECKDKSIYSPLDDTNYECAFIDNKCVEQPIQTNTYCSDYRGTNKEICESITLADSTSYSVKCIFKDNICMKYETQCSDATSEKECYSIILKNNNKKHCVYINNQCQEQYRTCKNYFDDVSDDDIINKTICENIVGDKCEYTAPTISETKGNCESNNKCVDFKVEYIQDQCLLKAPVDFTKKCVYSNKKCKKEAKTCLELSTFVGNPSDTDKESACKKAQASTNKECALKVDKTGCKEIDKITNDNNESNPSSQDNNNNNNNNNNNQDENNNSSKIQHLNELIIIILCLLF